MADDPAENPNAELLAAIQQRDEQITQANTRLQRMEETLNAVARPPQQQQPETLPPGKRYAIPGHLRQQIAGLGLSDAEIDRNGDLIVPFLQAYLGQAASEVLAIVRNQADDIQQLHMLRDPDTFPHADTLFNEVTKVRKAEAQAGRYMPVDVAYRVALANNYEKVAGAGSETTGGAPGGQFGGPAGGTRSVTPPPSPAAVRSRDASVGANLRSVRAPTTEPAREVKTGGDLMTMSREERKQFFAQNQETPIR